LCFFNKFIYLFLFIIYNPYMVLCKITAGLLRLLVFSGTVFFTVLWK